MSYEGSEMGCLFIPVLNWGIYLQTTTDQCGKDHSFVAGLYPRTVPRPEGDA